LHVDSGIARRRDIPRHTELLVVTAARNGDMNQHRHAFASAAFSRSAPHAEAAAQVVVLRSTGARKTK
jgi:hypothetical protein